VSTFGAKECERRSDARHVHTHSADRKNLCCPAIAIPPGEFLFAGGPNIIPRVLRPRDARFGFIGSPHIDGNLRHALALYKRSGCSKQLLPQQLQP
jgi:hypothetical protein